MLKQHIIDVLGDTNFSTEQKQRLIELLISIKEDDGLITELLETDTSSLLAELALLEPHTQNSDTFFPTEYEHSEEDYQSKPALNEDSLGTDTFFVDEFNLSEETSPSNLPLDEESEGLDTFFGIEFELTDTVSNQSVEEIEEQPTIAPPESNSDTLDEALGRETLSPYGQTKIGRYLDLGLLGRGGMGEVRKVRDEFLKRNLAMKIIHPDLLKSQNALTRFIEEAQVGSQLQHPNIVPIHEFGELPDGRLYFTMKEIRGDGFTEFIQEVHNASTEDKWKTTKSGGTFRQLIQIFHKICETIAYAHTLGVIHRDLKPENVMIGGFGEVLVVDWGIAKVLGTEEHTENQAAEEDFVQTSRSTQNVMATRMGMVAGTPAYMSPEQAEGRIDLVGTHSDIYTLGAILYEILSGNQPYSGDSAIEIVEKVKTTRPPSLLTTSTVQQPIALPNLDSLEEENTGKIPLPLIEICERAMEREISNRYNNASEIAEDIFNWLEGAQKRDRALKEFNTALELQQRAIDLEDNHVQHWTNANVVMQRQGFEVESSWTAWVEADKALKKSQDFRKEYRTALQGVLVYDSELEEANEALAKLISEDIIHAVAHGERQERESLERQMCRHLQNLSKRKQKDITDALEKNRRDEIILLRARSGQLVGRRKLQKEIATVLQHQSRLVSLIGTAGVGKSRLALEVIYDLQDPDCGTFFCDLTEANSELGVALMVAKAMNIKLQNIDPIGQLGEIFKQNHTLLVLDNLEQVISPVGNVITRWMEQSKSLRIIATSRIKLRLSIEHSFPLQPLTILEGIELFRKRAQKAKPSFELHESTRQTVGRLVTQLDNLPLAIELAAARLNIFNIEEIEHRLKERFSLLRSRSKGTQALQGALDWSWDLLKPWEKAALSQTSVFHGGFEINAAENVLRCGEWKERPAVFDILQDLCEDSLLLQNKSEDGEIRFGLMESIRQYAREKLKDEDSIEHSLSGAQAHKNTESRHAQHYSQFGQKDFLEDLDNTETKNNWGQFFEELNNFIAGTQYGYGDVALQCCMAALRILGMKGPVSLGVDIAGEVLQKPNISDRAKKQLNIARTRFLRISGRMNEARGDRKRKDERQRNLPVEIPFEAKTLKESESVIEKQIGELEIESPLKTTIEEDENIPEDKTRRITEQEREGLQLEADDLLEQGNIEEAESYYEKALQLYNKAMELYQRIGRTKGVIETHQKIGHVYRHQGDYPKATAEFESSLHLSEENSLFLLKADALNGLGLVCDDKGEYPKAIVYLNQSLETAQQIGDKFREEKNLGSLGVVHQNLGQYENAIEYYRKALKISKQIGNKRNEGVQLGKIANIYQNLGQYEKAIAHFTQALELNRQIGNIRSEGQNLGNLGIVYQRLGQYTNAIEYYKASIEISKEIGDKRGEGINLGNLGSVYKNLGDHEKAIAHFTQALELNRQIGNKRSEGQNLGNIANVYRELGQYKKAILHYKASIEISTEIGDKKSEGVFLGNLGLVYQEIGKYDESISHYKQAIEISKEIEHKSNEGINLGNLGDLFLKLERWEEAEQHLNNAIGICTAIRFTIAIGFFKGSLALVKSQQSTLEESLQLLKEGEPMVEGYPSEHGQFLCKKAKVLHIAKHPTQAIEALEQAKSIAKNSNVGSDSELGNLITETEQFLSSPSAR